MYTFLIEYKSVFKYLENAYPIYSCGYGYKKTKHTNKEINHWLYQNVEIHFKQFHVCCLDSKW